MLTICLQQGKISELYRIALCFVVVGFYFFVSATMKLSKSGVAYVHNFKMIP